VERRELKFELLLDYDHKELDFVRMDVKRLRELMPNLGKAIIKKSSEGKFTKGKDIPPSYHVVFPYARITKSEEETAIMLSKAHGGFKYFSFLAGDTTIRYSEKIGAMKPYIVEVIE
jgi:hypothetical protein